MSGVIFKFVATATNEDLRLRFRVDGCEINDLLLPMNCATNCWYAIDDEPGISHMIEIELSGKLPDHTQLDHQGRIIRDRVINISEIFLGRHRIDPLFFRQARYRHDHNGTTGLVEHDFHGVMGCNGVVSFAFESPHRIWLLEND